MESALTALAPRPSIAIACGGTGGHLFPGLAVADALQQRGCRILLLVSQKQVDQHSTRHLAVDEVLSLPAVGLEKQQLGKFLSGFWKSYQLCRAAFVRLKPSAVLAMGGFTSAPPVAAGKRSGARTFLHEANSIPGRANRLLAFCVDQAFVGFSTAARQLVHDHVVITGTPVRAEVPGQDAAACRIALGLDPQRPLLLVIGGSQGSSAINHLVFQALPLMEQKLASWQFLHLTGPNDLEQIRAAYAGRSLKAAVRPFLTEMELALGAATVALSRAGASSLAEFAAALIPPILIPYPQAADNHQFYNARAYASTGAAVQLDQATATAAQLVEHIQSLGPRGPARNAMQEALRKWQAPNAAKNIADQILQSMASSECAEAPPPPNARRWALTQHQTP